MNNTRRNAIKKLIADAEYIKDRLDSILEDEQDALDNMPESLQDTERYERMEEAVSNLEYALDGIDDVINYLDTARE